MTCLKKGLPRTTLHVILLSGVLAFRLLLLAGESTAQAAPFYLSPSGNDNNSGTLSSPWQTLAYGLGKLSPGDTLYLRGGTYYLHDYSLSLKGTPSAPILIQSYPGERASIDGGMPDFRNTSSPQWDLVNSSIQLYRSKGTYSASFVRAWMLDDDIQLVEYSSQANLESTYYGPVSGLTPIYEGPGIQLRSDGHIYIRLQYNPNDLTDASGKPISPKPSDTNPNNSHIAVFSSGDIFSLVGAEYLHFKDLDFSYSKYIFDVQSGTHHIELDGCRVNYGTYGLVVRDNIHDWEIHGCEFNNGLPDYVYWTDVKNGSSEVTEAYPEFQSAAIIGAVPNFYIHNNTFRDSLDSFDIYDGTSNTRILSNNFIRLHDDGMELGTQLSNVEIANNILWHVGSGISITATSSTLPGNVYIHHNIIDNSHLERGGRPGNYRASDWPVWTTIDPFGKHDNGNRAVWWKIYNNTIVSRRSGYDLNATGPSPIAGNSEKYIYNNIFYVIDDRLLFRDDQVSLGSHYDGDILWRNINGSYPFFYNFGNGGQYSSLSDFRTKSGTNWEVNGLQIDPGFNVSAIDNPTFDPTTIWDRYRPTSTQAFTVGISYSGLNWPGTGGVNYRGAIPATAGTVISGVLSTNITLSSATITWTTNTASDSQVEYGITTAYGILTPLVSTLLTSHSASLTGLQASTLYHYRVKSRDAAGNLATSIDSSFTTSAASEGNSYSISSTSSSYSSSGVSSDQVTVTGTGSGWIASINDSWVTITSGSSGSANGVVTFSVAPNTSSASRAGVMTIAGHTFTVTQAGLNSAFSLSSISTNSGPVTGGTSFTLQGGGFQVGASVSLSGVHARINTLTSTEITATTGIAPAPGSYDVVVTNPGGQSVLLSKRFNYTAVSGPQTEEVFVPIVLSSGGINGSYFTSEMTLTNRGSGNATVNFTYTASLGSGSGTGMDTLGPGEQKIVPDAISYLRSLQIPIPSSGGQGGTLKVSFSGLSSPADGNVTVRTTTVVPEGRAGLAYAGIPTSTALMGPSFICGLRQNQTDRSNVALQHVGNAEDGNITLQLTVFAGDRGTQLSKVLPDQVLAPGGFAQINGILTSNGLSLSNGYVRVERISGTAPYYVYGVINAQSNSDGSFIPPVLESALAGKTRMALPVVVETTAFSTELVVTNGSTTKKTLFCRFVSDNVSMPDLTASFTIDVNPFQQLIWPELVQMLRDSRIAGIGARGLTYAGPLLISVSTGDLSGISVAARTSAAGGGGRYGLYYTAMAEGTTTTNTAWLYGLQENNENRTNLALINTGETDSSVDEFRIELFNGDTGAKVANIEDHNLGANRWTQIGMILSQYAPGVAQGYARIERTLGNNPFIAYTVINDGGVPNQRSGDGSFIASAP